MAAAFEAMQFGIFDQNDNGPYPLAEQYENRLKLIAFYDRAGFRAYHMSEHHSTPLNLASSPSVFLAAIAQRTERLRLGPLVYVLPAHHPLRLAEEICMLDHLSRGRLEVGIGRGASPHELAYFGVDPQAAPEMYVEAYNVIMQALTRDQVNFSGKHYQFADVPIEMKPLQRPHPPLWYGLRGDQGPVFAARHGMHGVTLGPDEKVANMLATFRAHWRTYAADRARRQSPVERPHCGVMRAILVADSDAEAERVARPAYKRWFDSLAWLWVERGSFPPISISADYDQSKAAGTLVVGSPDTVARILTAQAERIRQNYLVLMLAFGSLTHAQEMRSLGLFKREIMPKLAAMNYEEASPAPALATA